MRNVFDCEVGISDHTMGLGVAVASIALRGTVIEKHFTLDRSEGGVDSAFSLEPAEMEQLVIESERAWRSLGHISYGPTEAEMKSLRFRRSLYITRDIKAGETLSAGNLRAIRPGAGLSPKYLDMVIGKKIKHDAIAGTPLRWEHVL
jgi:sialic acid synthase SpsE